MKVLFVSRRKKNGDISPIVKNQVNSLRKAGVEPDIYMVEKGGIKGYRSFMKTFRKYLKNNPGYDIIHAHYSFTAFAVSLVQRKNLVVSLMGSDVKAKGFYRLIIKVFNCLLWKGCIVKSEDMKRSSGIRNAVVIPNGVDFERFRPLDMTEARSRLNFDPGKRHILFAADPARAEKNYKLAEEAIRKVGLEHLEIHHLVDIPNEEVPWYYNASDVVLLTSLWEGSPNVIKEATACNRPVVTTNVGDVDSYLPGIEGSAVTTYDPNDVAEKIREALVNDKPVDGRSAISFLDEKHIAEKILKEYKRIAKPSKS